MRAGITFFPDVGPDEKSAAQYFSETLDLLEFADKLGFDSVKIIEHYFTPYGGYSPDPLQFLAAASQRSKRMRLMTGAVVPAFNNPLKLAGQVALLDSLSGGRLDLGLARAFLPHEFDAFGLSMSDSRPLYEETIEALIRLLTEENVTFEGRFHKFKNVTSYPRPVQQPHPPCYVAAFRTRDSFEWAAKKGFSIMITPFFLRPEELGEMVRVYRKAYAEAGFKPGTEVVNINFRTYVAKSDREAAEQAEKYVRYYIKSLLGPLSQFKNNANPQYPGYDKFFEQMENFPYEIVVKQSFIGSPQTIRDRFAYFHEMCGGPIYPSIDFSYGNMPVEEARKSLQMFADEVLNIQPATLGVAAG